MAHRIALTVIALIAILLCTVVVPLGRATGLTAASVVQAITGRRTRC